jgi:hypothetical protein
VPRYFFHFSDGKRQFSDDIGEELSGLAAARKHAARHVREVKAALCSPIIQDTSGWSMTVTGADGKKLFDIAFDRNPLQPED